MPPDALQIFKSVWDSIPPARRDYVAVTGLCARPDGSVVGDRYPQDVFDSTAVDVYFRHRIKGEKFGCMRTSVLRKFPFPEDVAGFVPESLVWWAISRAGYLSRFINQVVRVYHDSTDSLSRGTVAVGSNAQGLYLLAWDMLQHHLEYFRYRPREFIMAAARYPVPPAPGTLGRGHGRASLPPDAAAGPADGGADVAARLRAVPPRPAPGYRLAPAVSGGRRRDSCARMPGSPLQAGACAAAPCPSPR